MFREEKQREAIKSVGERQFRVKKVSRTKSWVLWAKAGRDGEWLTVSWHDTEEAAEAAQQEALQRETAKSVGVRTANITHGLTGGT